MMRRKHSRSQEHNEPVDGEFGRFRDLLEHELASRARHRIRRANLLGLYDWLLATIKPPITLRLENVARLEKEMDQERAALLAKVRSRITERIDANRRLWRSRVLRQLTQTWGAGPLAGLLGLWSAAGNLIRSLILLRARTPTQALLAGGLALSQLVGEKWRERQAATAWAAEADLGLTEADLSRARSVLRGHLADAEIMIPSSPRSASAEDAGSDLSSEQLAAVALQVYQKLELDVAEVIEHRVARRAGRFVHVLFEIAFCFLPAYLVFHMGRNFFYEHLWRGAPCSAWTSSSRRRSGACSGECHRRPAPLLAESGPGPRAQGSRRPPLTRTSVRCLVFRLSRRLPGDPPPRRGLASLERDLKQLEEEVGGVLDLGLGGLRASDLPMLPPPFLSPPLPVDRVTLKLETTT